MTRAVWVLLHRWVGLVMAGFLLIAGLTGSLLVWYHELDRIVASDLYRAPSAADAEPLDRFVLRDKAAALYPGASVNYVDLAPRAPVEAAVFFVEGAADPATGDPTELPNDELFLDPATGTVIGERRNGAVSQGLNNLMPFVYRLHYSLALGTIGSYAFGIVALLWTIDCFVGAYLTLPVKRRQAVAPPRSKSWWTRWRPAWLVRWRAGVYKVNFDLHRAGGLWLWAMLFVLAWSSVAFNLGEVYRPVMNTVFATDERVNELPRLAAGRAQPGIGWPEAHALARELMAAESKRLGFVVIEEQGLGYDPHKALYRYNVKSSADVRDRHGSTTVYFDADTGEPKLTYLPTGRYAGDTVTNWLTSLHMANVWGLPMRVFVCAMGLAVAMLSATGVVVWLKKRRARRVEPRPTGAKAMPAASAAPQTGADAREQTSDGCRTNSRRESSTAW